MTVRVLPGAAVLAVLAACSQPAASGNEAAGYSQPGAPASPEIAASPAVSPPPSPRATATALSPEPSPSPGEPAIPEPGAPRPTTSLAEGPFAPGSGQAAADVVQTFVALVEENRLRAALRLWDRGTAPTEARLAARLARYRDLRANVGGPGRVEGAAGSRYVAVPIHVTARLKAGNRPVAGSGVVTLRRVGEVDGATAEQKRWHIYKVDLKPAQPRR